MADYLQVCSANRSGYRVCDHIDGLKRLAISLFEWRIHQSNNKKGLRIFLSPFLV